MNILEVLKIFFGSVFILFLPGLVWSYFFFSRKNIDWIERVALSFGLSLALVPIAVFWLNWLFHMRITLLSTSLTVTGLIVLAVFIMYFKKYLWAGVSRKLKRGNGLPDDEEGSGLLPEK